MPERRVDPRLDLVPPEERPARPRARPPRRRTPGGPRPGAARSRRPGSPWPRARTRCPRRGRTRTRPRRFSTPSRSSMSISSGKCRSPFARPWVSDAAQKPPLRPLAPQPTRSASRTATRRDGSASSSAMADHSPVNPPPTMATSTRTSPLARRPRRPRRPGRNQYDPLGGRLGGSCTSAGACDESTRSTRVQRRQTCEICSHGAPSGRNPR